MDLVELRAQLEAMAESLASEERQLLTARLASVTSAFPFNEYEYFLMFLTDRRVISFSEYERLRSDYVAANQYLELFELAPRIFGEIWGHVHVMDLDKSFVRASKQLDAAFSGEYDLWTGGIRVEVKAARAINTKKRGSLIAKALRSGSTEPFWMNFQQIKPDAADVFIFIGVWVDEIVYWVLARADVVGNRYLSHQHRGGVESQIGITEKNITAFDRFRVKAADIGRKVMEKGIRAV